MVTTKKTQNRLDITYKRKENLCTRNLNTSKNSAVRDTNTVKAHSCSPIAITRIHATLNDTMDEHFEAILGNELQFFNHSCWQP